MNRSPGSIVTGLVLLVLGVGFILQTFGISNFSHLIGDWWPVVIILFALVSLSNGAAEKTGGLITLVVGVVLLLWTLGVITVNVWALFWPFILIMIGLSLLFRRGGVRTTSEKNVDIFVAFGGADRRLDTQGFEGGNITALFGGAKLDLRKTSLADNASISTFTAFGGTEIIVPEDCSVTISGLPIFGAWDDKTAHPSNAKSKLTIHGTSLFGGVEIKN